MSEDSQLQSLLQRWEWHYRRGENLVARQLCPDSSGSFDFFRLVQEAIERRKTEIDTEKEKDIEDALGCWRAGCQEGEETPAEKLCPNWSKEWLELLDRRICAERAKLLLPWESKYCEGVDLTATELCPNDLQKGYIAFLQRAIDQRRSDIEEDIQDALDTWLEDYENGWDRTTQELRPEWPKQRLELLHERITARRKGLQEAAMFDDHGDIERSDLRFQAGDAVSGTDFILEQLLGSGGFGEVWKARSRYLPNHPVALKFCLCGADKASLRNEAALLDRIRKDCADEGFVEIVATNIDHSPPFIAYKYIEGGNLYGYLEDRFRLKGPCSFVEAAEIMLEILRPMAKAHKLTPPIAHRDLKPHNILVERSDCFPPTLKIADFGLGGLSMRSSIAASKRSMHLGKHIAGGTPAYASQEQMEDEDRQPNTSDDVHALGVIWYELLSGKLLRGRPSGSGWKERLAEQGLTEKQITFLQSCFDEEDHRPKDAVAIVEMIEKFLPSVKECVHDDIREITRLRMAGEDWRDYIRRLFRDRFESWWNAGRQGVLEAQWLIGMCWEMGLAAKSLPDYQAAFSYFHEAAKSGHPESQYSLACYHGRGIGGLKKDGKESFRWLEKAAENGQPDALYELGLLRLKSQDKWRIFDGVKWLFRAARQGHVEARLWCAKWKFFNVCNDVIALAKKAGEHLDEPSNEQSVQWLLAAAQCGHVEAQFLVGKCHEDGFLDDGRLVDWEAFLNSKPDQIEKEISENDEAIEWYRKAAEKGHLEAQFRLSQCLSVCDYA